MVVAAIGATASLASAAGSIAGAVGGSQKSGGVAGTSQADNTPWVKQQPYLEHGFDQANTNYNNAMGTPMPTQFVAGQNDQQRAASGGMISQGMQAPNLYQPWMSVGQAAADQFGAYQTAASGIRDGGIGAQSGDTSILSNYARTGQMPGAPTTNPALASSITSAGINGLGSLASGASFAQQAGQAAMNPNGTMNAAVSGAGALSANPYLDAQIDAANRDVNRDLTENTLPQLRAAAMQSGNANSSREGAMEAIATRGAADRMADTSAAMRGAAYSQGATLGATGYNQGLSTALGASGALNSNGSISGGLLTSEQGLQQSQNQFGVSSALSAANNAAGQNLAYQNANTAARLSGNAQMGQGLQMGLNATDHAVSGSLSGLQAAYTGASQNQQGAQQAINQDLANYRQQTQGASDLLGRYWNIVGGNKGSSTSGSTTTQPQNGGLSGALNGAIGGGIAGYGLYRNMFGTGDTSNPFSGAGGGFGNAGAGAFAGDGTAASFVGAPMTTGFGSF